MTNREAILRLAVNARDRLAMAGLHDNNAELLGAIVARYFGAGPAAEKAERLLMERLADQARTYGSQESPEDWVARCSDAQCDRMRNEAIHDKANAD